MQSIESAVLLEHVEAALAFDRPFGDARYILGQIGLHYNRRLAMLAEYLPEASALVAALAQSGEPDQFRVLGDPAVRCAIDAAVANLKLGVPLDAPLEQLKAVLDQATRNLIERNPLPPLQEGARQALGLGSAAPHTSIWCDQRTDDASTQLFRGLFETQEGGRSALRTPDENTRRTLETGARLLQELLPELSRSALHHVSLVAVVDVPNQELWSHEKRAYPFDSFTTAFIPASMFIFSLAPTNPLKAAEYLLHEALHEKLYDLQHTHSILRPGYQIDASPPIHPLWNRSRSGIQDSWPVCRALAAFHVYVHLALFFQKAWSRLSDLEERYGPLHGTDLAIETRRALDRANYLGHRINENASELGLAGQRLTEWLFDHLARTR